MNDLQSLQSQIQEWHEQTRAGKLPYQALAALIHQKGAELKNEFARGKIPPEQYEALRSALVLTDAAGVSWQLFQDGSWRRQVGQEWRAGQPDLSGRAAPASGEPGAGPTRLPWPLIGGGVGGLLLIGIIFFWLFSPGPPATTPTPTEAIAVAASTETSTATPEASTPEPTATETPVPAPTFTETLTPSSEATTPSPEPPTPAPASATPTESPTSEVATATFTPAPAGPSPTATPLPEATLAGTLVYAVFNPETTNYDTYFRSGPDFTSVAHTISKAGQPGASPDGRQLALRSWDGSRLGVLLFDAPGWTERSLSGLGEAMHPDLSAGGRLVYSALDQASQQWRLYVEGTLVPLDGSAEGPVWLGQDRLAFGACITNTGCGIYTVHPDGSGLQRLTDSGPASHRSPAPSPDGGQLVFMSNANNNWDLYRIATDASPEVQPERLTSGSSVDAQPVWSPDGQWIAFLSGEGGQWTVQAIPAGGGEPKELFQLEGQPEGFVPAGPAVPQNELTQGQMSWLP